MKTHIDQLLSCESRGVQGNFIEVRCVYFYAFDLSIEKNESCDSYKANNAKLLFRRHIFLVWTVMYAREWGNPRLDNPDRVDASSITCNPQVMCSHVQSRRSDD